MRFLDLTIFVLIALLLLGGILFIEDPHFQSGELVAYQDGTPTSSPVVMATTVDTKSASTSTTATSTVKKTVSVPKKATTVAKKSVSESVLETNPNAVNRIQNPYPFPPESFTTINENSRGALVNILCTPHSGTMQPVSGSGTIIDPRGVILTNAHVAQYILLSQSKNIDLSCVVRSGSPAVSKWRAKILYIPPMWVNEHAVEITSQHAVGTGEHDYALLLITGSIDEQNIPYPFIPIDTRHAIGFEYDSVLAASYPAEFIGGLTAQNNLYAVSSITTIKQLLSFVQQTVDLISLGGTLEAQGGSSGGAVVNQWGRLIGLIVTTSAGETTGERDLRALTLSYIDRDMAAQTGHNLTEILGSDVAYVATDFNEKVVPNLIDQYIHVLTPKAQ